MFFDDSRKAVTTIMAKRSPKGEPLMSPTAMKKEVVKDEDGQDSGLHAAAQDIIAAHHEKSPHKLMEAMSNFINIHKSDGSELESGKGSDNLDQ